MTLTTLYSGDNRESRGAAAPVNGSMLPIGTNTGRFPSLDSVKRGVPVKLTSNAPGWFMFREYVTSMLAVKRLRRIVPFHCRLERRLRVATHGAVEGTDLRRRTKGPRETDSRAHVHAIRNNGISCTEEAFDVRIFDRTAIVPIRIDAQTILNLQILTLAPRIAQ